MNILVHRFLKSDAINDYNYLIRKLNKIFPDKVKTLVGLDIDIFDVHIVFRYCPLQELEGYCTDYYCTDSIAASEFFLERSHRCIPRPIELFSTYEIYSTVVKRARELQYIYNDVSVEIRLKLLNIAQKHNFNLLFSKYEQYIGNEYRAIFINDKQEEYKVSFDISCYPDLNAKCFQDLEERIVRYLGNGEENNMDLKEFNFGTTNAIYAISNLKNAMINAGYEKKSMHNPTVDVASLYPEHMQIARSKCAFYGVPGIKKVIFNNPATIILWVDGTKTVVKAQNGDTFDKEKGLAMAIVKKALGNEGRYYEIFKKWL